MRVACLADDAARPTTGVQLGTRGALCPAHPITATHVASASDRCRAQVLSADARRAGQILNRICRFAAPHGHAELEVIDDASGA
jgi:hypothetical protein